MNPANVSSNSTPASRNASTTLIEDTFTWLRGKHSLSMGGSWTQYDLWSKNQQLVPNISLGATGGGLPNLQTGDPAQGMFGAANFPGASAAQLNQAQALYAILTGRITQIQANGRLNEDTNEYQYLGLATQRARMREAGFFVQDSWRVRPDLTINAGLRYELQFPFTPRNNSYSTATVDELLRSVGNKPRYVLQPVPGGQPAWCAARRSSISARARRRTTPITTTGRPASAWPGRSRVVGTHRHPLRPERRRLGASRRLHEGLQP